MGCAQNRQYASLLHLPSGCPARPLAGAVPCGVRTFLSQLNLAEARSLAAITRPTWYPDPIFDNARRQVICCQKHCKFARL